MIYLNFQICISVPLTLHDGGRYHIETSTLICKSNQWTGFYMITATVMKELNINHMSFIFTGVVVRMCSVKKLFLKISQNSLTNTCARVSFLTKLQNSGRPVTLLKKRLLHRCFPFNFAKYQRTPFLTEHLSDGCF